MRSWCVLVTKTDKMKLLLVVIFLVLTGCTKYESNPDFLSGPVECFLGKEYSVTSNLSFTIDSIRDYRCPQDVVCIWAGDVDIFFSVNNKGNHIDTTMQYYKQLNNPLRIGAHMLKVTGITPVPQSGSWRRRTKVTVFYDIFI